ncbi:dienelactone hydrolase (plasmid) [Rhizobium johnstonii]|uniref:alpha/beta hydrolase family protein n=1 Tax=Rhizobium leguminosarum TaxID=384 RepID=UPI001C987AA4|nr:dienelactone hydrolase [Rhizobium leguminosarum]MBY5393293.1 dienelactone hydrolase [Rhizobium leguminosarum]WSG98197.1 dienelactone hydrolase [Rhizobium johnstonii]
MNNLIDLARHIPTPEAVLTVSYSPIRLPMDGREPLELRLTAPASGGGFPIVLLSHGFGPSSYIPSKDGYAPLAQFWSERGFAVIQPTHASSRIGGLPAEAPGAPFFWRERVQEMKVILDRLPDVERQALAVAGQLDHSRIAAAGHSFGGHTVGLLLGARIGGEDLSDPRISAGILMATPGRGGKDLTEANATRFPFFDVDFSQLSTRSLVVCGDGDDPHFTTRGPEWHADAFHDGPGAEALLVMRGVGHGLGGIAGLDAKETEIEAPDVLEATKRLTIAWLRTALHEDLSAWAKARAAVDGPAAALAHLTLRESDRKSNSELDGCA